MFEPFRGLTFRARQQMRADGDRRQVDLECLLIETGACVMNGSPHGNGVTSVLLELVHYFLSHRVLYVPTPLAERLMATRLDIPPIAIQTPYQLFELSFDDKLEVRPGLKLESCLAMVLPDESLLNTVRERCQQCSHAAVDRRNKVLKLMPPEEHQPVQLADRMRRSFLVLFSIRGQESICQLHFRPDEYTGLSMDEAIDKLLEPGPIPGFMSLSAEEIEMEKALCRIVFGALCYLGTKEPEVGTWKDRCRPRLGIAPKGLILGQSIKSSVGWHLRKAHWRFFKHEKFTVPYTWVHSAEINVGSKPGGEAEKSDIIKEKT